MAEDDIRRLTDEISKKYGGSTRIEARGSYVNKSRVEQKEQTFLLSVIAPKRKSILIQDLQEFKERLKTEFKQEAVLITYHDVIEIR